MAEVYTGASTWMLQVLSKNEYPVIMLQTSFSCTCDAVTAKTFTCYPQLTWHPAVCYYIVASPALSGSINLPSPFSPITGQLTDLLELSDLSSFLCIHNQYKRQALLPFWPWKRLLQTVLLLYRNVMRFEPVTYQSHINHSHLQ